MALRKGLVRFLFLFLIFTAASVAKDPPAQVIVWPSSGPPVLRFSVGKFKETSSSGKHHMYSIDVTAENLWGKRIAQATFSLYLFDKDKIRIGDGYISVSDVAPAEVVKFQVIADATGNPVSMVLSARSLPSELQAYMPATKIAVMVNSVPQGASVKLDGVDAGVTPKVVQVAPGKHMLEFSKEGFNTGHFPLEVTPDDVSGGSVSYELGTSAHDTLELRDGSVVNGDLESVSATEVVVRVGGIVQRFDRNQVKRIGLVPRETPQ